MKLRSAGVDEIFNGAQYEFEAARLPRWQFWMIRAVYMAALVLLRRLAR